MTRDEAVARLLAAGAVLAERGDVRALRRAINASDTRRRRRPKAFHPQSQCSRKWRYPNEDAARRGAKRTGNVDVRPYACVYCGGWHNGNPPKG